MYQFSRALYRDLHPLAAPGVGPRELLSVCERAVAAVRDDSDLTLALVGDALHLVRPASLPEAKRLLRIHLDAARDAFARHIDDVAEPPVTRICAARGAGGERCDRSATHDSRYCAWHQLPALVAPPA